MKLINQLAKQALSSLAMQTVSAKLDTDRDAVIAIPMSARSFLLAAIFAKYPRPYLVVIAGEDTALAYARELSCWLGNDTVLQLPIYSAVPWKDAARKSEHAQQVGMRARAINALSQGKPQIVVASARALLRILPPPDKSTAQCGLSLFTPLSLCAACDLPQNMRYEQLSDYLVSRGYERLERLDTAGAPGAFSIRGDTIDLYPSAGTYPVRIELFGDYIEAIRRLVPATGQSIGNLEQIDIYPVRELELNTTTSSRALAKLAAANASTIFGKTHSASKLTQHYELIKEQCFFTDVERYLPYLYDDTATVFDYLSPAATTVLIEPRSLFDDCLRHYEDLEASAKVAGVSMDGLYMHPSKLDFGQRQRITMLSLMGTGTQIDARIEAKHADCSSDERLAASARSLLASHFTTVLSVSNPNAKREAQLILSDAHLPFVSFESEVGEGVPPKLAVPASAAQCLLQKNVVNITATNVAASCVLPALNMGLLTLNDQSRFGAFARSQKSRKHVDPTSLTFAFKPGDYVVHSKHGIALFKEIVRQDVAGVERDYLYLEYAHGDKLFTPVEQIDKITRYVGPESSSPRLTRLNTSDWSRATGKARAAARKLAFDLVDLYARREAVMGFAFAPDNEQQYLMEEAFDYDETPDQRLAIADVKADMQTPKPMDRLICGDVGFGKTEVALRAAFKAVQSGKQVMLLCPTTILAQQHYVTFNDRFDAFAVKTEVLSRFRTPAQQKVISEEFHAGKVDVLVGTHRLLSADVNPRDLGLIIIDEEQRFGVQHKEQLKNIREQVDVLTLSATPIPRTMQMAISGVRDMSMIDTPPASRTPIKVHVGQWDGDLVSAAIRHEIERGGQVYYVSNRVKTIDEAVARVIAAVPEARIGIAHGKMSPSQLENIMESFAGNEYDVLIATTIIESGLDNPHTNTLIIEDSQRLGLAQLYQLKGRVGRSHAQAYAYFLFPSEAALTEEATARLTAIDEFQELGSGLKIAMRDLEIRGAGSLLGAEQHGMLSAVGFDLFASMLKEAVLVARNGGAAKTDGAGAALAGDSDKNNESGPNQGQMLTNAFADVHIDLPLPCLFPEEYIAAADERVLFYRRLAAAQDIARVEELRSQLESKYGAMPASALNLVDRTLARAMAAEQGINSIYLQRSKFVIEPVELNCSQAQKYKAQGATYMVKSKRLLYPVQAGVGLLNLLINLLQQLAECSD